MTFPFFLCALYISEESLRNDDDVKKTIGFISKTTLYVHHAFLVHFFDVHCTCSTMNFPFPFWTWYWVPKNSTPGKMAYIWQIVRVQTRASAIEFALVSTVLRKSVRFFIIDISQLKNCKASSKVSGTGQYHVWMTRKPRKGDFREFESKKFPGGVLEACAFGARLENRSVFIPDPRLVWRTQIHYLARFSLPSSSLFLKLQKTVDNPWRHPWPIPWHPWWPVTVLRLGPNLSSFLRLQNGDQLVPENCPIWGFNYSSKFIAFKAYNILKKNWHSLYSALIFTPGREPGIILNQMSSGALVLIDTVGCI